MGECPINLKLTGICWYLFAIAALKPMSRSVRSTARAMILVPFEESPLPLDGWLVGQ
jgi:hypothetical protein